MTLRAIQPTFAGGEFDPALYSRIDIQRYASGLRKAKNVFVHPHGGVSNRPGLGFIANTKTHASASRLVRFVFSTLQAYVLEFGAGYIRFYKDGGQILKSSPSAWLTSTAYVVGDFVTNGGTTYYCLVAHTSGTFATDLAAGKWTAQSIYEIPTDYAAADLFNLKFTQSADVLYITHPDYPPAELTRTAHDAWTLADFAFVGGPFMRSNTDEDVTITTSAVAWATTTAYAVGDFVIQSSESYVCLTAHTSGVFADDLAAAKWYLTPNVLGGSAVKLTAASALFDSDHVGALWKTVTKVSQQQLSASLTSAQISSPMACGQTWRMIISGTWAGSVVLEKSTDGGVTWATLYTFTTNADASGDTGEEQCILRFQRPTSGAFYPLGGSPPASQTGTAVCELSCDEFDWTAITRITSYTSSTVVTGTAESLSVYDQATDDWAEGSWSPYRGYPSCSCFYQDRLVMANSPAEPNTAWQSKTNAYADFGRSNPLVDSDGITTPLPSQRVNAIKNLLSLRDIVPLTSDDDWIIGASDGIMTPTTVLTKPQGGRGSSGVDPALIGNRIIAVQPMGQVLRDIAFDLEADGLGGRNISVYSSHLFRGYSVVEMAYAQEPDSLLWVVRSDGKLLSLTYLFEQDVLAWTWHETDGEVESVCTIPGTDHDEVWFIVNRTIGGTTKRFVERLAARMETTDPQDQFFVDSGLSLDSPVTISGITKANPGVVTATSHGFSNGDIVDLAAIEGMTELNGRRVKVANKTTHTFELTDEDGDNINTTSFTTYVSDGEARKAVASVMGLDHLEGKTVAILANGSVQAQAVVTSGAVALSPKGSIVHIGLPYTSDIETLNIEVPMRDGPSQGRKMKIAEVLVRVINTRGIVIGPSDESQLDEMTFRSDEDMGAPMALQSGDLVQSFPGGWEDFGRILIRQEDPLPMTVTGLVPRLSIGG